MVDDLGLDAMSNGQIARKMRSDGKVLLQFSQGGTSSSSEDEKDLKPRSSRSRIPQDGYEEVKIEVQKPESTNDSVVSAFKPNRRHSVASINLNNAAINPPKSKLIHRESMFSLLEPSSGASSPKATEKSSSRFPSRYTNNANDFDLDASSRNPKKKNITRKSRRASSFEPPSVVDSHYSQSTSRNIDFPHANKSNGISKEKYNLASVSKMVPRVSESFMEELRDRDTIIKAQHLQGAITAHNKNSNLEYDFSRKEKVDLDSEVFVKKSNERSLPSLNEVVAESKLVALVHRLEPDIIESLPSENDGDTAIPLAASESPFLNSSHRTLLNTADLSSIPEEGHFFLSESEDGKIVELLANKKIISSATAQTSSCSGMAPPLENMHSNQSLPTVLNIPEPKLKGIRMIRRHHTDGEFKNLEGESQDDIDQFNARGFTYMHSNIDYALLKHRIRPKIRKDPTAIKQSLAEQVATKILFFRRFIFFPLYYSWWKKRAKGGTKLKLYSILYVCQLACTIFVIFDSDKNPNSFIAEAEITVPFYIFVLLAALFVFCIYSLPTLADLFQRTASSISGSTKDSDKESEGDAHEDLDAGSFNRLGVAELETRSRSPPLSISSHVDEENSQADGHADIDDSELSEDSSIIGDGEHSTATEKARSPSPSNSMGRGAADRKSVRFSGDELGRVKGLRFKGREVHKVKLSTSNIRQSVEEKADTIESELTYRFLAKLIAILTALSPIVARIIVAIRSWYSHNDEGIHAIMVCFQSQVCEASFGLVNEENKCALRNSSKLECSVDLVYMIWYGIAEVSLALMPNFGLRSLARIMCTLFSAASMYILTEQFFTELCLAEETFWRRFQYARFFKKLTSEQKARRANLPHFRLTKATNIRVWLSLRMRRTDNPRESRTSDISVNFLAYLTFAGLFFMVIRVMSCGESGDHCITGVEDVLFVIWLSGLLLFSFRLSTLYNKTVGKYNSNALLYTELLNLQLLLSEKRTLPAWKVEEYKSAVDTLRIMQQLLKVMEPEGKHKSHKLLLNPWIYNILRVVILSALGSVSNNVFGFKVRLWKL